MCSGSSSSNFPSPGAFSPATGGSCGCFPLDRLVLPPAVLRPSRLLRLSRRLPLSSSVRCDRVSQFLVGSAMHTKPRRPQGNGRPHQSAASRASGPMRFCASMNALKRAFPMQASAVPASASPVAARWFRWLCQRYLKRAAKSVTPDTMSRAFLELVATTAVAADAVQEVPAASVAAAPAVTTVLSLTARVG